MHTTPYTLSRTLAMQCVPSNTADGTLFLICHSARLGFGSESERENERMDKITATVVYNMHAHTFSRALVLSSERQRRAIIHWNGIRMLNDGIFTAAPLHQHKRTITHMDTAHSTHYTHTPWYMRLYADGIARKKRSSSSINTTIVTE